MKTITKLPLNTVKQLDFIYVAAFVTFITRLGQFMSIPFIAIYLTQINMLSPFKIGLVLGVSGLTFSITSVFNGVFLDICSQRRLQIISLMVSGVCYFGLAYSMQAFVPLLLFNAILGWSRSLADIGTLTLMVNNTEESRIRFGYNVRFIALNLGVILGPIIGATMAMYQSPIIFIIAASLHFFLGFMFIFLFHDMVQVTNSPSQNVYERIKILWKNRFLMNITFINFIIWLLFSQLETTIPQYITVTMENPAVLVSALMVINAIICVSLQSYATKLAEMHSLKWVGIAGSLLLSLSFILISTSSSSSLMIIAIILLSFGELLTLPVNGLFIAQTAPKNLVASYIGFTNLGMLGMSAGPIIGGYGLQTFGHRYTFIIMAILCIVALKCYQMIVYNQVNEETK